MKCLLTTGLALLLSSTYTIADHLDFRQHPIYKYIPSPTQCRLADMSSDTISENMTIMHIDLDYVFDHDKAQQHRNIQSLIKRIKFIQPNTIFLQAFADPDGNGSADAVYFENRHIRIRENLFNSVSRQIRQQTSVDRIFAWLPLMAWQPAISHLNYVQHARDSSSGYIRLSPFDPENIRIIAEIYADFALHTPVDGLVFHDDITLNDFEDIQPLALATYKKWGFHKQYVFSPWQPHQQPFTKHKTEYLDQLAYGVTQIVKCQQPHIKTARNSYAPITLNPSSELWFAQSLKSTFQYYDYNAIMAMPYMEQAPDHKKFYQQLVQSSQKYDPELKRTIFELQAKDWQTNQAIDTKEIKADIIFLKNQGVRHIGYYPDDFVQQHPNTGLMRQAFQYHK